MPKRSHLVIPDTQVKPGLKNDYLEWIGKYIADRKPDVVVHLGDHWDMPSLSSYDKGLRSFEGRRYHADVNAGNEAMDRLLKGMGSYKCRMVFLIGNHEQRIERLTQAHPELYGTLGHQNLNLGKWEVHGFLSPVTIDGVKYCHYFPRSSSGAIVQTKRGAPNARAQLIREGGSCTAGHQQGLDVSCLPLRDRLQWGMIAGSCYPHEEEYLSPQGTTYWRGVIVKHEVEHGTYCPMFVSLDYLKRQFDATKR